MAQHKDEYAMEYLRRIVGNLGYEYESILSQLPSVQAIVDYFELFDVYDSDFFEGIEEAIAEGSDPKPLHDFIDKYKLGWRKFTKDNVQNYDEEDYE